MNSLKQKVVLKRLKKKDREQFILDNQEAFRYGAMQEFGLRDDHFEEDGEIISRKTIEDAINCGIAYRIVCDRQPVGGIVLHIGRERGELELLFVTPQAHNRGIGYAAWCEVEKRHSEVRVWETVTPYFEKRNIHFYVNRCGFHIVEFFNRHHRSDPFENEKSDECKADSNDEMFRLEKQM